MLASLFARSAARPTELAARPSEAQTGAWPRDRLVPATGLAAVPNAELDVKGDHIEIWIASCAAVDGGLEGLRTSLTQADFAEINKVRHAATRVHMATARAQLRIALTHAVCGRMPAHAWQFERTGSGQLSLQPALPGLRFSVSHAAGLVAIAVSHNRPVGIDIEAEHSTMDSAFLKTFLSRREWKAMRRLPEAQRLREAIHRWTLKEAYAKLLGIGLAADLTGFEFHLKPARLMCHCEAADAGHGTGFWTWHVPGPRGSCRLALAVGQPTARQVH
ncbi:MAG TPA: 4'-phosphopantetheinyl transferase superfamily protein [Hyphomicrobiaceae bacterium]|nr:4'-phosphopantetheinyl transferase superfamily protein [Hyphomicrobiaceae bacterium]